MFDDESDGFLYSHNEVMSRVASCHLFIPHPNASETAPPILHSAQQGQSKVAEVVAISGIVFLNSSRYSAIGIRLDILIYL